MKIKWISLFLAICLCFGTSAAIQAAASGTVQTDASTAEPSDTSGKIAEASTAAPPDASATEKPQVLTAEKTDASNNAAPTINWYNYQEGLEKGKAEDKKVFINFFANWCHYCKVMKKTTFKDKKVIAYLNENFIPIRVNADKEKKLAASYQVTGLPMSWFVGKNGEHIGGQPGYIPPDTLLPLLQYIHTDSYKTMNFKTFKENM